MFLHVGFSWMRSCVKNSLTGSLANGMCCATADMSITHVVQCWASTWGTGVPHLPTLVTSLTSLLWDLNFWPVPTGLLLHGRPGRFLHLLPLTVIWFWNHPFLLSRTVLQGGSRVGLRETIKGPGQHHLLSWQSEISSWFTRVKPCWWNP